MLDANVDEATFARAKQLILGILSEVNVNQMATRVSVVRFSISAQLAIRLIDLNSHQDLITRFASITASSGGSRNLDVALQLALQELQDTGRVGVNRIMYIISFGESVSTDAAVNTAQSIHINDITLVGIGNSAARPELERIVFPHLLYTTNNLISSTIQQSSVDLICTQGTLILDIRGGRGQQRGGGSGGLPPRNVFLQLKTTK